MNVVHDSVCMEPVAQRKKNQWIAAAERVRKNKLAMFGLILVSGKRRRADKCTVLVFMAEPVLLRCVKLA